MRRLGFWDVVEGIAAVASIIGLVALLVGIPTFWRVAVSVLLIIGVVTVCVVAIRSRQPQARTTKRDEMMTTGEGIIRGTMRTLVMFGGDMSWAGDYSPAIKEVTDKGKTVVIIYPKRQGPHAKANADLLEAQGARLNPISEDTGLRGFLVDPHERKDARFWLATRRLKKQGESSVPGAPGGLKDYQYITREFRADQDPELIEALLTIYRLVCP